MRASWLLGLALLGCSFEHGRVPGDASTDVPSNEDSDGDGVLDADDNCPGTGNADQRDHDADDHGDVCDLCPHLPSAADPDGDGDNVGDDCDPRPQTAGDRRVLWEGFDTAASISAWDGNGTWSVVDGEVQQLGGTGEASLTAPGTFQRLYVASKLHVLSLTSGAASIGMCSGQVGSPASQYYCCIMRASGPILSAISYSAPSSLNENLGAPWSGAFSAGAKIDIVQNQATQNACSARQTPTTASRATSLGPLGGTLRIYTRDSTAAFDYVFVVEVP